MSFNTVVFQPVDLDFFYVRPLKAFINERKHQKLPHKTEDNRSETNMPQVEMDPHVARLLGSLALSAAASENHANEKSTKAAGDEAKSIVSSHPTNSDSSDDLPSVSHAHGVHQYKGSSPLPSQVPQVSQQRGVSSRAHDPTLDSPRSHKTSSTLTVRPRPPLNGITEENLSPLNNNRTTYPTSALTSPSQAARRATSTADISPYLTRAADPPISATRLKQLSLLETVANESARMSSAIAVRAAMTSTNSVVNGYPLPPLSVPPQPVMLGNTRDPGLIYSSDHPRVPLNAPGFQPVYNPSENNFHEEHDAFQVRSRTSQSMHRTLPHNPTGSINIHQNHLLAAMNGSGTPSLTPSQYGPQFIQQHQPLKMYHAGLPTDNISMHSRHIPPPQTFHGFSPALQPLSSAVASSTSTNFGLHPMTVNPPYNPLLSILNNRSSLPQTVPAQFHQ
jgi:mRNA-decapping enzyme subunit 2